MGVFEKSGEYYDLIYQGVRYDKECDLLENIFAKFSKEKPESILDIGCGTGSHALILSKRGYNVAGLDISKKMIEEAKRKAEKEKVEIEFFAQDMRDMKLNNKFDCAICMFGAFDYILTYEDLSRFFSRLKQHLNKEGLFIFEYWSIGGLKPYLPYKSWMKAQKGNLTLFRLSESNFDPETNILNINFNHILMRNDSVESFDETHKLRCYTLPEIQQYLSNSGFKFLSAYDWEVEDRIELKRIRKDTFRILAVSCNTKR